MKYFFEFKSALKANFRHFPTLAMFSLILLSGHLYSQNQADYLSISTIKKDTTKTPELSKPYSVYDTIPRFYNRIWNLGFGFAFPLQDFHASDPQDTLSGYALQGVSLSTGLFLGFKEGGEAGWYFGAAYSGFNTAGFMDTLQASAAQIESMPTVEAGSVTINEDIIPRYDILSLSTGLAFEGSDARVSVYGSLLANINFTRMNTVGLEHPTFATQRMSVPFAVSTGFTAKFGFRFQQQLNVGVAWHYLGRPVMNYSSSEPGIFGFTDGQEDEPLSNIPMSRRINFLEVQLGYAFIKRGGYRPPRVKITYFPQ